MGEQLFRIPLIRDSVEEVSVTQLIQKHTNQTLVLGKLWWAAR
jgi:hypothetical protein